MVRSPTHDGVSVRAHVRVGVGAACDTERVDLNG